MRASVDLAQARVTVSWDEITGLDPDDPYKLELGYSNLGVQPTTVEWPDPTNAEHAGRIMTDMFVASGGRVSRTIELPGLSLPCGPDKVYSFRVSALGNRDDYLAEYGPTTEATFGALTTTRGNAAGKSSTKVIRQDPLCLQPPEVDVIPLPRREGQSHRKVRLLWDEIEGASSFDVHIAKSTVDFDTHAQEFCASPRLKNEKYACDINVDNVVGGEGLADVGAGEGFRIRVTVNFKDTSLDSQYSDVIIVDSPIRSVNGDADDTLLYEGRFKVKWDEAGTASDNVQYTLRWRVLRPYELASGASVRHDNPDWRPTEWELDDRGTPYDWASKETDQENFTIDIVSPDSFMLTTEEIYAFQLNYTINGEQYFSAREAYGWTSNRAADDSELVATFPSVLRWPNKTYAYNICESTFSADVNRQAEWRRMIVHAFDQWEAATDGLVTMRLNAMSDGKSEPCVNYEPVVNIVKDAIDAEIQDLEDSGVVVSPDDRIETSEIRYFVKALSTFTNLSKEDAKLSEVIMVHVDDSNDVRVAAFNELSDLVGFDDCIVVRNALGCALSVRNQPSVDILINDTFANTLPVIQSVAFDKCLTGTHKQQLLYETLVHEAGHALGLFNEGGGTDQEAHHPQIKDSVMSYSRIKRYHCSPSPFDIMAIYAIYQTLR